MRGLLLATIMTLGLAAQAQENFKEPFIEVSGVSEMEIDPNEIVLWIRLKEFEENKNKVQLEKIDQRFLNALKEAGIDKKRLTLADAGATLSKVTKRDKEAFREKTYELTLTGSAELERFLSASAPVEIDNMRVTRVDHTDIEKYKLEAKTKALQIAKNKAQVLAESIGSGIGKPLMIREWDEGPVYPMMANVRFKAAEADMSQEDPVAFRKIRLKGHVTAQFEIR